MLGDIMAAINDVTGDALVSRLLSDKGSEAFDRIFGEKKKTNGGWKPPAIISDPLCKICGKGLASTQECAWTGCPLNWDEKRTDIVGANGNDGLHYEAKD
jgi:hypothetical protein